MPSTLIEKILSHQTGRAVRSGEMVSIQPDVVMFNDSFFRIQALLAEHGFDRLADPVRIHVILDHNVPPRTREMANRHNVIRAAAASLGIVNFYGYAGVSHQVLCERGVVRPGTVVFGTDSHSSMYGALGAAGMGIGATEGVFAIVAGSLPILVPPTLRVCFHGCTHPGVMAMDLVLWLLRKLGRDFALECAIEFTGPGVASLPVPSRMTIANMGVELGAQFSLFPVDTATTAYLGYSEFAPLMGDPDAPCVDEIDVDLASIAPQVAHPHDPGNVHPLAESLGIPLTHAYFGSCTNGRIEDLRVVDAVLRGRKVAPSVTFTVTPASRAVMLQAVEEGIIGRLMAAGAHVGAPGCGACFGGNQAIGDGDVCISTTNRNFVGRMGSPRSSVYLASPATVAASAVAGYIDDPRLAWSDRRG
jgi:3-isopropylmalate/(R)-2-methylmalate dehydratase large subunit